MSSKALDTPPSSSPEPPTHALPPSPPLSPKAKNNRQQTTKHASLSPVDRLIGTVRLLKAGRLETDSDWLSFRLSAAQYAEFEGRVAADKALWGWYCEKARWDWTPPEEAEGVAGDGTGVYVLRMPSAVHEFFIARIEDAVVDGIAALSERLERDGHGGKKVMEELNKVWKGRSPTLEMTVPRLENSSQDTTASGLGGGEERVVKRSPDATFFHPDQQGMPCLVIEVAYSQQKKELPRLAESYVVDSSHRVRCVIGLDITYVPKGGKTKKGKMDKRATLSVWRPGVEEDDDGEEVGVCRTDGDATPFRDTDGAACEGVLTLHLADLLPRSTIEGLLDSAMQHTITIPFTTLASALLNAETVAAKTTEFQNSSSAAPQKFRKRKRTPSEEVSSHDDEVCQQAQTEMEADGEWKARVRRRRRTGSRDVGDERRAQEITETMERRRSLRRRVSGRAAGSAS